MAVPLVTNKLGPAVGATGRHKVYKVCNRWWSYKEVVNYRVKTYICSELLCSLWQGRHGCVHSHPSTEGRLLQVLCIDNPGHKEGNRVMCYK